MSVSHVTASRSIPIEGLVHAMKRGRTYTLGLATAWPVPDRSGTSPRATAFGGWMDEVAQRCMERTDRNAVLIRLVLDAFDVNTAPQSCDRDYENVLHGPDRLGGPGRLGRVHWTRWQEPLSAESPTARARRAELASLPRWKDRYALVVLDLECMDSHAFGPLSKQCDGIAVLANASDAPSASFGQLGRSLRRLQSEGTQLLGLWSED